MLIIMAHDKWKPKNLFVRNLEYCVGQILKKINVL